MNLPNPVKRYEIGTVFRREKPNPPDNQTEKLTNICQKNTEITPLIIKFLKVRLFDKTAKILDIKMQKYTTGIEE